MPRSSIRIIVPARDGEPEQVLDHDPIAYRKPYPKGGLGKDGREKAVASVMDILTKNNKE